MEGPSYIVRDYLRSFLITEEPTHIVDHQSTGKKSTENERLTFKKLNKPNS